METETTPPASGRPRPLLLILLGIAVLALAVVKLLPSGSTTAARPTSNQPGSAATTTGAAAPLDPKDLDVRLEGLAATRPEPSDESRNPFGFAPKPEPPPPPRTVVPPPEPSGPENAEPSGPPPGPAQPPPIPLKYLGIIEGQGKKLAALSDCKFTYRGEEGEIVDGRYRLVKIQVESVIMEYVDGRGRTTIRLSGQDCVGR